MNDVYSTSSSSSSLVSNKHSGGNKTHQKFSPCPSPNVITSDS